MNKKRRIAVRIPGIGGQGAVTAAHIMATAASNEGYYSVSNPFFGAEKRMAPAESYVRIGLDPIFDRGEVVYPDVIMVFHPQVITMGKSYTMPFYSGIRKNSLIIINSEEDLLTKEDRRYLESIGTKIFYIPATLLAEKIAQTELSTNMAMLGAFFGATRICSMESVEEGIKTRFLKKFVASGGTATLDSALERKFKKKQELFEKNVNTAKAAYEQGLEWAEKEGFEPMLPRPILEQVS